MALERYLDELRLDESATLSKTFTETDISLYVAVTCDFSPIHIDERYAAGTRFGSRIVPGILMAGFLTSTMAPRLVGCFPVSTGDSFEFLGPVRIGDTIAATLTIAAVDIESRSIRLDGRCENQHGDLVLRAVAHMKFPRDRVSRPPEAGARAAAAPLSCDPAALDRPQPERDPK